MSNSTETHGVWTVTAPSHPTLFPMIGECKTDVAVIGGGYTGLSAALHLAEAGTDVTLLEAKSIGYAEFRNDDIDLMSWTRDQGAAGQFRNDSRLCSAADFDRRR